MNDLQNLLRLRRVKAPAIARSIGYGYHAVQKTIKGTRKSRRIQEAIAKHQGLTWEQAFGVNRTPTLKRLIRLEIAKRSQAVTAELESEYLDGHPLALAS